MLVSVNTYTPFSRLQASSVTCWFKQEKLILSYQLQCYIHDILSATVQKWKIGRSRCTNGGKFTWVFGGVTLRERVNLKELGVDGSVILNWV